MGEIFRDRQQAGQLLAEKVKLELEKNLKDTVILALPRGGVLLAAEISKVLNLPFDILIVRKIGHPRNPEYGLGALAEGEVVWMNPEAHGLSHASAEEVEAVIAAEKKEIKRRVKTYRRNRALPLVRNKTVVLVDDGLATGVTARAAAEYAKNKGAAKVILAVPACSQRSAQILRAELDAVVCLKETPMFYSVGQFYEKFGQLSDEDVLALLPIDKIKTPPSLAKIIGDRALPLRGSADLAPLIEKIKSFDVVMLGESSHGTQEFYEWRRLISQELIGKHGFKYIAVEGDWPPCHEVTDFIQSKSRRETPAQILKHFRRWPTWMWANTEMIHLVQWMKEFNRGQSRANQAGFFGLDVYSFFESMDEVLRQLRKIDAKLARAVQLQYECFDPFYRNEKAYARHLIKFPEGCEAEVLKALENLLRFRLDDGPKDQARLFDATQNARIITNAERYYRAMIHGNEDSWNVRDQHMFETLEVLRQHHGPEAKGIVWVHNTHVGDYRATSMLKQNQVNLGGLAREQWGADKVALIGFGTHHGQVTASRAWDGPIQLMDVPAGRAESYEAHFHDAATTLKEDAFFLWLKDETEKALAQVLGHRAIGVVYHPEYESRGNYVPTSLSKRYDAFIFVDETSGLTPLHQDFTREEIPETWPLGM